MHRASLLARRAPTSRTSFLGRVPACATGPNVASRAMSSSSDKPSTTRAGEPPLAPGFVETYQLSSPSRFVPLALGAAGLLSATGLYHWNEESQILGLFLLFTGTVYSKGGDAFGKMLDETSDAILKEQNALEDAQIAATKLAIAALEKQAEVYADVKQIQDGIRSLEDLAVETAARKIKHDGRRLYVLFLEYLVAKEQKQLEDAHRTLVAGATETVRSAFKSADLKQKALSQAIAAIKAPGQADNLVNKLYTDYIVDARKKAEKTPEKFEVLDKKNLPDELKGLMRREGFGHLLA